MKKIISSILTGSITFMLAVAPAIAASTDDPGIQKREALQQKRIDQGVESGQLTPKEAGKLDNAGSQDQPGRRAYEIGRQTHEKGKSQTDKRTEQGQQKDLQEET